MSRNWAAAKKKLLDEGACRICGATGSLDPAHVIPRSLGGDMHADATVPLCRSHHSAFDAHDLDLLPVLTRDEQAHAVRLVGLYSAYRQITGERP